MPVFAALAANRWARIAAAIIAAALAALLIVRMHDRRIIAEHDARTEARAAPARDAAAQARASDAVINATTEKDMHDAINAAPTGTPLSAPARNLACERLRRVGRIPPACR